MIYNRCNSHMKPVSKRGLRVMVIQFESCLRYGILHMQVELSTIFTRGSTPIMQLTDINVMFVTEWGTERQIRVDSC
jgi:hypothetical protein